MADPTRTGSPLTASLADTRTNDAGGAAGAVVAPDGYDLVGEVGRGGMGVVYRARDRELNREVAVKILQERYAPGTHTAARFVEEAHVTAQLQHPGIPPVHRVGALPDGRPFLVMKLIKGHTLDALTASRERERPEFGGWLGVFEGICQAVGYAHAHGVIHRDLKPANIMVGAFGEVQVMDWGLAKLIARSAERGLRNEDGEAVVVSDIPQSEIRIPHSERTQSGSILGTPAFMAPEQAIGAVDRIDRRTDVFGLGAILCSLLTGKPPFVGDTAESTRQLAARSQLTDAFARLDGCGAEPDLIALCKRCLSGEPEDRPADATEVAAAVAALRVAADERARRAEIEREKAEVATREQRKRRRVVQWAGGLTAAVLLAGVVGTAVGLQQARAAKQRETERADGEAAAKREAVRQADLSRRGLDAGRQAIDRGFTRVSEDKLLLAPGLQPLRKELLEDARRFYQQFIDLWGDEPTLRVELGIATGRLAAITGAIGSKDESDALYRQAIALLERAREDEAERERADRALATLRMNLGLNLLHREKNADALEELDRSLALHRRLPRDPDEDDEGEGTIRGNIALALIHLRRLDEAEGHVEFALAAVRRALKARPNDPRRLHSAAGLLNTFGSIRTRQDRPADAEKLLREAADTERKAVAAAPAVASYQEWLGNHLFNLAMLLDNHLHRPADALAVRTDALAVWEKLVRDNPAVIQYRLAYATSCADIANAVASPAEKAGWYERAVPLLEQVVKDDPTSVRGYNALGASRDGLSEAAYRRNDLAEAERQLLAAVRAQEKAVALGPDLEQCRRYMTTHHINLARVYAARKKPAEAIEAARTAVAEAKKLVELPGAGVQAEWKLVDAHSMLGRTLNAAGRKKEAPTEIDHILEVLARIHRQTPDDPKVAEDVNGWFTALADGWPEKAGEARERQAAYWRKHSAAHPDKLDPALSYAWACLARSDLAFEQREWGAALEWGELARTELQARLNKHPTDPEVTYPLGQCLKHIGDVHWKRDRMPQAVAAWDAGATLYQTQLKITPDDTRMHHLLGGLLNNLGRAEYKDGKFESALARLTAAVEHQKRYYARNPDAARQWLSNHLELQADTLRELGRWTDAATTTRERANLWAKDAGNLVGCARDLVACAKGVAGDPAKKGEADGWAAEAVGWLRTAVANGAAAKDLSADAALAPLREREDFRTLAGEPAATREVLPPPRKEK